MELRDSNILIIEDSPEYILLTQKSLGESSYHVYVETIDQARERLKKRSFDLILLDIMMPDGDGFQFYVEIRNMDEHRNTPVIFLTSRGDISDRVMGLSLGAQDYVVKPFDLMELRARVINKLQYSQSEKEDSGTIVYGDLSLDLSSYKLTERVVGGDPVLTELSPLEVKLLTYLIKNKEAVLTRQQILDGVWGGQVHVLDRTVDSAVAGLRKKMGHCSKYIRSVHGVGYMLTKDIATSSKLANG